MAVGRRYHRAVGYCENSDCVQKHRGVFLLNNPGEFYCPCCREEGFVEAEEGSFSGNPEMFNEVRVEFDFAPADRTYSATAIVRDESLGDVNQHGIPHGVYVIRSPLVKTHVRALKVAESVLSTLSVYGGLDEKSELPRSSEVLLSFDKPRAEFAKDLVRLSESWEAGPKANIEAEPFLPRGK